MSVLFYRRPDYLAKSVGPINASDCARYVERAKSSERVIPEGLSFDDVLNNKSLPPCALSDFMDYLVYVEHTAENLQFFLWYRDYVTRFDALPQEEKNLSPEWVPEVRDIPTLMKDPEKESKYGKGDSLNAGTTEDGYDSKGAALFSEDKVPNRHQSMVMDKATTIAPSYIDPSVATSSVPSTAEVTAQAGLKWQPFSIQPMREEVNRITRHYLAATSPRELNLSHKDRATCLHALQHTTHPSAFHPAIKIVEAALRGQSHPNFIRWSICNGNKPKIFFVRTMGVSHILLGCVIGVLLILSRASRWWRIFALPILFIGFSTMIAAYKGLCVILHKSHVRNLHPWEQDFDEEGGNSRRNSFSSTANRDIQMASRTENYQDDAEETQSVRPASFQTFGSKNSFESAEWIQKYEKKPMLQKVFEKSVWTQDQTLRVLQDRIILGANIWALILTTFLTILFVAVPSGSLY